MSVFIFDIRNLEGLTIRPIKTMMNHNTTEVFFDNVVIPEDSLIGEEGSGFKYILDGMNAERILIAAECIGDGRFFLDRAVAYANSREIFGGPIGKNQGVQFPLARAYMQLRAADLVRFDAAARFDAGEDCGAQANTAKFLAAEASWAAGNVAIDTHGGMGFAQEYDIERKFRETRLYQVAPINNNLVMAYIGQHVLGLPKSY
jgi:acyl-CoA dehydrogenase